MRRESKEADISTAAKSDSHRFVSTKNQYRQVGVKGTTRRDARFGIRRGRKDGKGKGEQSLESAATLTLGSMLFARFSTNYTDKFI